MPRSTLAQRLWSDEALYEHLRFFNGSDVAGRATGTAGYATAAAYVAARMAEFELQAAVGGNAQVIYLTSINEIRAATLAVLGSDTLALYPGIDFLPDGRSDSGQVDIRGLLFSPPGEGAEAAAGLHPDEAVVLPAAATPSEYLETLRDAGARVVLSVGPFEPQPAAAPIHGLLVIHILPETVVRLMGATPRTLADHLENALQRTWRLPQPVRFYIDAAEYPKAGAINVLAYVPGRQPVRARELVIVCADLDAIGTFAGVPMLDAGHLGTGTAALLEVARQYATFARFASMPERTLLFAVFSGARQGYAGLQAYLRYPLWPFEHTRAVIYAGLDAADEPAVRGMLADKNLPLYALTTSEGALNAPGVVLLPARRSPRQRTLRPSGEEVARRSPPRTSDLIDAGVVRARLLADSMHTLLLREAATSAPFMPVDADTLRIPPAHDK